MCHHANNVMCVSGVSELHLEALTHFSNPLWCGFLKFMGLANTSSLQACGLPCKTYNTLQVFAIHILEFVKLVDIRPMDRWCWVCDFLLS